LLAIWRAAAVKPANAVCQTQSGHRSGAAARPIVGKPDSYARRAEATSRRAHICWSEAWSGPHSDEAQHAVCQAYRGVSFAGEPRSNKVSATMNHNDLPRSGSKTCECGVSGPISAQVWGRCAPHRRQAGLLRPSGRSDIARAQTCWSEAWSGPHSDEAQHAVCQAYRGVSFAGEPRSNKISATLNHNVSGNDRSTRGSAAPDAPRPDDDAERQEIHYHAERGNDQKAVGAQLARDLAPGSMHVHTAMLRRI